MYFTFGPGIVILALALASIVVGVVLLVKLLRTDWNMSVSSFNARFAHESSLGQQDMELDAKRRAIARNLGITPESMQQRNIGIVSSAQHSQVRETEVLLEQQIDAERTEEL